MFYHLSEALAESGGTKLFSYTTMRAFLAFSTAFILGLIAGRPIINMLYRKGMRSKERSYGDINTQSKSGTPIMGGLIILVAGMGSTLLWCDLTSLHVWITLLCGLWFALVGGYDDYHKVKGGSADAGLSRVGKYLCQFGMGAVIGWVLIHESTTPFPSELKGYLYFPLLKDPIFDLGYMYIPFAALVVSFITNAVNFTDGLDGLVTVPSMFVFIVFAVFAYIMSNVNFSTVLLYPYLQGTEELVVLCSAMIGGCLGFLWFNAHPAEVFMGDMGSLMIGGVISSVALLLKQEALFVLVGAVFVAELFSTLVQERLGLAKGKRIFYRAPLHHTFQHQGMSETKIVVRLWIVSAVCAAIALLQEPK